LWVEYIDQAFPAVGWMLTQSGFPGNSNFSVAVFFLRHDRSFESKVTIMTIGI